jgi:hypothetical protein
MRLAGKEDELVVILYTELHLPDREAVLDTLVSEAVMAWRPTGVVTQAVMWHEDWQAIEPVIRRHSARLEDLRRRVLR